MYIMDVYAEVIKVENRFSISIKYGDARGSYSLLDAPAYVKMQAYWLMNNMYILHNLRASYCPKGVVLYDIKTQRNRVDYNPNSIADGEVGILGVNETSGMEALIVLYAIHNVLSNKENKKGRSKLLISMGTNIFYSFGDIKLSKLQEYFLN